MSGPNEWKVLQEVLQEKDKTDEYLKRRKTLLNEGEWDESGMNGRR